MILCPNYGDYLEVVGKKLRQIDTTLVVPKPAFATPTRWKDMLAPRSEAISFDCMSALAEMILIRREAPRILDAPRRPRVCQNVSSED